MGPDRRPILAEVALVYLALVELAREQAPNIRKAGIEVVGVGDLLPGASDELLTVVAEDVAEPLVEAQPAPLQAGVCDADNRALKRCPEDVVALL